MRVLNILNSIFTGVATGILILLALNAMALSAIITLQILLAQ